MIIFRQRRCCTSSRKLFLSPSYLLIAFVQDCALYLIGIILFWCCKKTVCIIYFSEGRGGNLLFVCIFSALKTRLFKVDWYVLEHVSLKNIISCKKNKDFCWFNFTCSFYIPLDPDSWPKWIRIHDPNESGFTFWYVQQKFVVPENVLYYSFLCINLSTKYYNCTRPLLDCMCGACGVILYKKTIEN